jgi:uncharacterized protein
VRVLIAGVSTRAAAESAARAGFAVTTIDAFADLDQHPSVHARALHGRFSPETAARESHGIACDAVVYGSNFENDPEAVSLLARGRMLWGNPAGVLRRVRDPALLSAVCRRHGLASPEVQEPADARQATQFLVSDPNTPPAWLVKRRASGGGHGVRAWREGTRVPHGAYLQRRVDGTPGSVVFVAAGGRAVAIGLSRQLLGDAAFGVSRFRYCGNILTAAGEDDEVVDRARNLADVVAREFGLVGVNGIDFVVNQGVPHAVEANPRWCASMELVERTYGVSVFNAHAIACQDGVLPDFELGNARRSAVAVGKAVVYARRDVTVGDTRTWLSAGDADDLRDVPRPQTRIRAGQPVCTVFASGRDFTACRAELVRKADRVYTALNAML